MSTMMTLCAPCLFGLESIVAREVKKIGGSNIQTTDGKVTFMGDSSLLARANLSLRCAERVCIVLGIFVAESFVQLFDQVGKLPFEDYIGSKDAFPVKGWSLKSKLHSVPACQSIIKKAVAARMERAYGQSWFEESGPAHQIQFSILKDTVTVMLDTSGPGLHKRGYRRNTVAAPIKETLAAGIADLARIRSDSVVVDPMCGSGTLLIEAAMHAYRIPPGVRRHFAAERWGIMDEGIWRDERQKALDGIDRSATFTAYGYDVDEEAVRLTVENAGKAGVGKKIEAARRDICAFAVDEPQAIVLCNPPYGERLLGVKQTERLYRKMGQVLNREGLSCFIISPHEQFEELFGRKADKRRKLYNGMIKCQLYMYYKKGGAARV